MPFLTNVKVFSLNLWVVVEPIKSIVLIHSLVKCSSSQEFFLFLLKYCQSFLIITMGRNCSIFSLFIYGKLDFLIFFSLTSFYPALSEGVTIWLELPLLVRIKGSVCCSASRVIRVVLSCWFIASSDLHCSSRRLYLAWSYSFSACRVLMNLICQCIMSQLALTMDFTREHLEHYWGIDCILLLNYYQIVIEQQSYLAILMHSLTKSEVVPIYELGQDIRCMWINDWVIWGCCIISFIIDMLPKKKLQHISYGITKNEANYQISMIQLMNKLLDETRENNQLLRKLLDDPIRNPQDKSTQNIRRNLPGISFQPAATKNLLSYKKSEANDPPEMKTVQANDSQSNSRVNDREEVEQASNNNGEQAFKKMMFGFQDVLSEVSKVNRKIYEKLEDFNRNPSPETNLNSLIVHNNDQGEKYERALLQVLQKRQKIEKKTYSHYGILSQIMPFSDKREIKVRYKIADLMEKSEMQNLNMTQFKQNTTEWVGMIFRASASICWNMLSGGQLNFEEVKVLFTENIIFNFIEYMKDIHSFVNEDLKLQLTDHINTVSCEVLQFLCRQYPQTKIEAPNIALRNAIPKIENQGQSKYDLVAMMCRKTEGKPADEVIEFQLRADKDYSTVIMKSINHMIDQTQAQFPHFERIMTNIFEKIYLPKEKRAKLKPAEPINLASDGGVDSQYRQKVKSYSSYLIGRKIPKNTPKYNNQQIQYGVFFVKAPSILRIITKWFEELWEFVNTSLQKLKASTTQIKDHQGCVLNISTRVKHALYLGVCQRLAKIKSKIERIKTECYNMQFLLADPQYTSDDKQMHLSEDQLSVGKYCSNLKNAISSYVCTKLSKLIYYLLLIPQEINEKLLNFNDEDLEEQARKHLDKASMVYLKIFDLLRCKCHSNEEQIIFIVEALKQLDRQDPKFELVRVKDRLSQGTRDIMINAQYDGGLVWEIQLSVTSRVDKKQDLLDKYNHFLYELKRSQLGPISECVSIWSSLEQRSIYFELLYLKKKAKGLKGRIEHKKKQCKDSNYNESFSQFKRPIICVSCKEYFAIPMTSLLNARCEDCRITYCGPCYYSSLPDDDKKRFIFQNFDKRKLLNSSAYHQLEEFSDFKKPFPKQGFFIKKKFLNRELSFYTLTKVDKDSNTENEFEVSITQTVIRGKELQIRGYNKKEINVIEKGGEYYLKGTQKELQSSDLGDIWIFSFKNRATEDITVEELQKDLKDPAKGKMKYLNVLFEPNYMNQLKLYSKIFEKIKLMNNLRNVQNIQKYKIAVYRFPNLTVLAKIHLQEAVIQESLVKKGNRSVLKQYAQKMMNIIYMQESNLSDEIDSLLNTDSFRFYFMRVKKLYLADNDISSISCFKEFKNLQSLYISKNQLTSLEGIEDLVKLYYIKFDQNNISSLLQFKKLVSLTYVSGNINCISRLQGLEMLENLNSLSLCQNQIVDISEIKSLGKLKRLYLRDNPIESILVIKDILVKHLYFGNTKVNPIELLSMKCITIIKELGIKNLKLPAIPNIFDNSIKLIQLKLSKNNIRKIEHIEKLVNLERLDLSQNQISKMENLETLENLQVLNLKNNQIVKIECVKTFIETLQTLQLQLNPLDSLTEYLIYEEKPMQGMRLKFSEGSITGKAKEQLKNHVFELGSKSESDG